MQKTVIGLEGLKRTKAGAQTGKAMAEAVEKEIMKGKAEKAVQVAPIMRVVQKGEGMKVIMEEVGAAIKTKRNLHLRGRLCSLASA